MAAPRHEITQMDYQNPHATAPLRVPVMVVCNTPDEELERNIRANAARDLDWIGECEPHDGIAVLIGGGPSVEDFLEDIPRGTIFAMNGAARWLRLKAGIRADYQVIADAKPETATLIDHQAKAHLFASQVHPDTMEAIKRPVVWHALMDDIEDWLPQDRVKRGGYALIGGGGAVGNYALCLAWVMGYRTFHIYGFDSCHRGEDSHAYPQPMNNFIPCATVEWAGKTFKSSVAMKGQAERFQITAREIEKRGGKIHIYGEGLLQTMYRTPPENLSERDKYRLLWRSEVYREGSPGERGVPLFLHVMKAPPGMSVIDFGCGTGRASLSMAEAGLKPILIDFADNCRDEEAIDLPFIEWDLTKPIPATAPLGFCADVMEHIPTDDVETVIGNIMNAAEAVWFQISTRDECFGSVIGTVLHNTVQPHGWWRDVFTRLGLTISLEDEQPTQSTFLVTRILSER